MTREDLLQLLLAGKTPPGASQDELIAAFASGVDRAQREGSLGPSEAAVLRTGLRTGGLLGILGLLLAQ